MVVLRQVLLRMGERTQLDWPRWNELLSKVRISSSCSSGFKRLGCWFVVVSVLSCTCS